MTERRAESGSAPLAGIIVVCVEQALAAPLASCRLADAGARVIKVERPEGDFARGYDRAADGLSSYFAWANRGKESIVLDLAEADDRRVMTALLARADVFIQNLSVGAIERLGYGAQSLLHDRPDMVICDLSGYGQDGPYANMKAYDLLVQAESGLLAVSGAPGPIGRVGVSVADIATGTNAALAIMMALFRRERNGVGAHLTTSLFEGMAEWMTVPLLHYDYLGKAPDRVGLAHPSVAPYGGFETADGQVMLISIQSDREWVSFCDQVLRRPELATDPQFVTNNDRVTNRTATDQLVADVFSRTGDAELVRLLESGRIAYGFLSDVARLSAHPQLRRIEVGHSGGSVSLPAPPVRTDWETVGRIPDLDEHGAAIRAEFSASGGQ